jgi:MAF protein
MLILASSSPRRRTLLAALGIPFEVRQPHIDETQAPGEDPFTYVRRMSQEKALAIAGTLSAPATVLAADTIELAADTTGMDASVGILGKPIDADDARRILRHLRGRDHTVCTAFTLTRIGASPLTLTDDVRTTVTMREYSDAEIDAYIATGDPFDKAGSYAIQHEGFRPVAYIEGDYNNVVGLPLDVVRERLVRDFGFTPSA